MKYSYEFKKERIQLYKQGKWPDTPDGTREENLHASIRKWFRLEELHDPEILDHENNIHWTPDEKLEMVSEVLAGNSTKATVIESGINEGQLCSRLNRYKKDGYSGLASKKEDRKSKSTTTKKRNIHKPEELNESEREGLIKFRAENGYMEAENEIIKEEIVLGGKRYAA